MCKNTVDGQVIPSCWTILSHFKSGWRGRPTEGPSSQNKCPINAAALLWPFSTSVILLTFDPIFPPPPPHPFQASALIDNTPSIWRWRTTHTGTVKQLSGKETAFYLLWVLCFLFVFLLFMFLYVNLCSRFYNRVFILFYVSRPLRLGWGVKGRDSCVRIRVWHFSYRANANLTKTHMHANVNPHQNWWGMHGI